SGRRPGDRLIGLVDGAGGEVNQRDGVVVAAVAIVDGVGADVQGLVAAAGVRIRVDLGQAGDGVHPLQPGDGRRAGGRRVAIVSLGVVNGTNGERGRVDRADIRGGVGVAVIIA